MSNEQPPSYGQQQPPYGQQPPQYGQPQYGQSPQYGQQPPQYGQQQYGQGYPPAPPAPAGKVRLRGRTPLRLALIFGVVGIVLAVVGGVVGIKAGLGKVDSFTRVSVAQGQRTVQLDAGKYLGYYEAPGYNTSSNVVPVLRLDIRNVKTGKPVTGQVYGNRSDNKVTSLTYDYDGHHGAALYQFTIPTTGTYQVTVQRTPSAAPDSDIAIGSSIATGVAAGAIVLVVGVILIVVAIILLIIGLVKRSRNKRELANAPAYGYGAPGYPPPPGQPGGWSPPSS